MILQIIYHCGFLNTYFLLMGGVTQQMQQFVNSVISGLVENESHILLYCPHHDESFFHCVKFFPSSGQGSEEEQVILFLAQPAEAM